MAQCAQLIAEDVAPQRFGRTAGVGLPVPFARTLACRAPAGRGLVRRAPVGRALIRRALVSWALVSWALVGWVAGRRSVGHARC